MGLRDPRLLSYLSSFIAYTMVSRNGIFKDGRPCVEATEEEMKLLYPDYRPELLPGEIRQWIEDGVWEKERIVRQISEQAGGAMDKKQ